MSELHESKTFFFFGRPELQGYTVYHFEDGERHFANRLLLDGGNLATFESNELAEQTLDLLRTLQWKGFNER